MIANEIFNAVPPKFLRKLIEQSPVTIAATIKGGAELKKRVGAEDIVDHHIITAMLEVEKAKKALNAALFIFS